MVTSSLTPTSVTWILAWPVAVPSRWSPRTAKENVSKPIPPRPPHADPGLLMGTLRPRAAKVIPSALCRGAPVAAPGTPTISVSATGSTRKRNSCRAGTAPA
jgi:hypothetical protein